MLKKNSSIFDKSSVEKERTNSPAKKQVRINENKTEFSDFDVEKYQSQTIAIPQAIEESKEDIIEEQNAVEKILAADYSSNTKTRKSRKDRQSEKMNIVIDDIQKEETQTKEGNEFDVMNDPDYPPEAVNSNIIVEEIEMNGRMQRVFKKTYYLIDGKTLKVTRTE